MGHKNDLVVYKVESSLKADTPESVKIIAVERQNTAEVEVQVWKTIEGTVISVPGTVREMCEHVSTLSALFRQVFYN